MDSMDFQFATLPLYDLAETRIQTDALWYGLASSFRRKGIKNVPDTLFRGEKTYQKKLFFGQICGFPLTHEYARRFKVIATPLYRTPYFTGPEYLSVITVHKQCKWQKLEDARGSRVVINSRASHSGRASQPVLSHTSKVRLTTFIYLCLVVYLITLDTPPKKVWSGKQSVICENPSFHS